jgi:hypothetical protein
VSDSDLEDAIRDAAAGPAEAHGDSGGVKQQPLPDLLEADRYLRQRRTAAAGPAGFLRFVRLVPPGAV